MFFHSSGIAKHTFSTWIGQGILDDNSLNAIERRVGLLHVPSDVGRIARNISKCYTSLKADEWKHWTMIFSMFSLRGILPTKYLNMWSLFVNACFLICRRSITPDEVDQAHLLLRMFCKSFEAEFGKERCVPNMHLSLHLRECILNYGSVYSFWCFSFERYNGVLGRYQTNNHSITIQVMRKFVLGSVLNFDSQCNPDMNFLKARQMFFINQRPHINGIELEFKCSVNLSVSKKCTLPLVELHKIESMLQGLYDGPIHVQHFVQRMKRVEFLGQVFANKVYRSKNTSSYSRILARHPVGDARHISTMDVKPGVIIDLLEVIVEREENGEIKCVPTMIVKCFFYRTVEYRKFFGVNSGIELWSTQVTNFCYIPMKFILGRYACVKERITVARINHLNCSDNFNVVIRLPSKSVL